VFISNQKAWGREKEEEEKRAAQNPNKNQS
jgi:hypothetical protein